MACKRERGNLIVPIKFLARKGSTAHLNDVDIKSNHLCAASAQVVVLDYTYTSAMASLYDD